MLVGVHRGDDGSLVLCVSDLAVGLECAHRTALDRRAAEGRLVRPPPADGLDLDGERRRRRAAACLRREVERLAADGREVVSIDVDVDDGADAALRVAASATAAAMRRGADVVVGATFHDGRWCGRADLLQRVDGPSTFGDWHYEVLDTSGSRRPRPAVLVPLAATSALVAEVQGVAPAAVVVVDADGGRGRIALADLAPDLAAAQERLGAAVGAPIDGPTAPATSPDRVPHCRVCPWASRCDAERRAGDHLSLVAGVRPDVLEALRAAGITSGAALAATADGVAVPGIEPARLDRLRRQARLQLRQRADGVVRYELLDEPPGETPGGGLASLPAPSPGDLFFDIEGDPLVGDDGVEYLFGLVEQAPAGGEPRYRAIWGHGEAGERSAFEAVVDHLVERLAADPAAHVYHYAAYEVAALRKLAARHGTRRAEVERLVAAGVFVDLYRVVRDGVLVSQEGYGLKKLEPLYLGGRTGAITDGGASVVAYEGWLADGDEAHLADIQAYNEVDCRSTLALRDWLEARRAELEARRGAPLARPPRTRSWSSTRRFRDRLAAVVRAWRSTSVVLVVAALASGGAATPAGAQTRAPASVAAHADGDGRPLVTEALGDLSPQLLGVVVTGGGYPAAYDEWREAVDELAAAEQRAATGEARTAELEGALAAVVDERRGAADEAAAAAARHDDARGRLVDVAVGAFLRGAAGDELAGLVDLEADDHERRRVLGSSVEDRTVEVLDAAEAHAGRTAQRLAEAEAHLVRTQQELADAEASRHDADERRDQWAAALDQRRAVLANVSRGTRVPAVDLRTVVLDAYARAAAGAGSACALPWSVLAGIGRVETRHGEHGGSAPDLRGRVVPRIVGIPLDGTRGTMRITDSDGGALDGDTAFDRAVGPMQFIPSTWRSHGVDGDGDGTADPNDLDDAAASAAGYLCDVAPADGDLRRTILAYNRSESYVDAVLGHARAYARLELPVAGAGGAGALPPAPNG